MPSPVKKMWVRSRLSVIYMRSRYTQSRVSHVSGALSESKGRVVVGLAADYGNLGDLAITYAQIRLIERYFPDRAIVEVPISATVAELRRLAKNLRKDDIITLVGGGNTGDMYDDIQYLRELYVKKFPDNPIIAFPQTMEFSESPYGKLALRRARRVFNRHARLTLLARDSVSYDAMSREFPKCSVRLAPDVVLTLDQSRPELKRSGVLMCLRQDGERSLGREERERVVEIVQQTGTIRWRDTHVGAGRLSSKEALAELESIWADFRSADLVVTDRLHGMIFATITGTRCIAIDSRTGKVGQFYRDWLQGIETVRLLRGADAIEVERCLSTPWGDPSGSARDKVSLVLRAELERVWRESK